MREREREKEKLKKSFIFKQETCFNYVKISIAWPCMGRLLSYLDEKKKTAHHPSEGDLREENLDKVVKVTAITN